MTPTRPRLRTPRNAISGVRHFGNIADVRDLPTRFFLRKIVKAGRQHFGLSLSSFPRIDDGATAPKFFVSTKPNLALGLVAKIGQGAFSGGITRI